MREYGIRHGDVLERLAEIPAESVHCVVTSPPYWGLRDYGVEGQIGLEPTPEEFIEKLVKVFRQVHRLLRKDGTVWINIGDSYTDSGRGSDIGSTLKGSRKSQAECRKVKVRENARTGLRAKNLQGIPWRVALALQADGWYLRSAIIWAKPNGMPGSQEDRPTSSYEMVFLLTKSPRYFSDFDAIKTPPKESSMLRLAQDTQAQAGSHRANGGAKTNGPMRAVQKTDKQRGHSRRHEGFNARWDKMKKDEQMSQPAMIRDVWFISPATFNDAHFAVMPMELARRCILAGCPESGTVLDPFSGTGTTALVATRLGRSAIGIELNAEYVEMSLKRLHDDAPLFAAQAGA